MYAVARLFFHVNCTGPFVDCVVRLVCLLRTIICFVTNLYHRRHTFVPSSFYVDGDASKNNLTLASLLLLSEEVLLAVAGWIFRFFSVLTGILMEVIVEICNYL